MESIDNKDPQIASGDYRITLRPAALSDIPLLKLWDQEPDVAASDPNDDWDWETETLGAEGFDTFIAEKAGSSVGVVQITDLMRDASRYWGEPQPGILALDMWIGDANLRGHGLGQSMMQAAIEYCFTDPTIHTILVDPINNNKKAISFYRKIGFIFFEERRFGNEICAVHRLRRQDWEKKNKV